MSENELAIEKAPRRQIYIELFIISAVLLYLELACIRFFGSIVIFLTFFTNVILMASFLGMSLGCMVASRPFNFMKLVLPAFLIGCLMAGAVLLAYVQDPHFVVDIGNQGAPQLVFFGTEWRRLDLAHFVIPIEVLAGIFYVLIALVFVGPGQVMGRAFNSLPNPVLAYTANISGSLLGIALFGLTSYFEAPPVIWFSVSLVPCLFWIREWRPLHALLLIPILLFAAITSSSTPIMEMHWSPYYEVVYFPRVGKLFANNIGHQQMSDVVHDGQLYSLLYLLKSAVSKPDAKTFGDVLIIGAGSGNDVAASLQHGAKHVDAVEIDPVLNRIGAAHHPNRPYSDPRVSIHVDDGRSFLRHTQAKYDLAIFGIVDSLVLHSGFSNLRLESFLFTKQSIEATKQRLKPGGILAFYAFFRQDWILARLYNMTKAAFGADPVLINLSEDPNAPGEHGVPYNPNFIIAANGPSPFLDQLRSQFAAHRYYWLNEDPSVNVNLDAWGPNPPAGVSKKRWMRVELVSPAPSQAGRILASDSWPFLYLQNKVIPEFNLRGMALIAMLSAGMLFLFAPERKPKVNGQMFFLGAGFMLLETKSVVHMALLFGSTWVVNSAVFAAILVMILMSSLLVLRCRPTKLWPYYLGLIVTLAVNALVPMEIFLDIAGPMRTLLSCAITFCPIFFAGVVFAASFRESKQHSIDFGSNVAGAILGGLSEYLSLVLGFNQLLFVAVAFYLAAFYFKPGLQASDATL